MSFRKNPSQQISFSDSFGNLTLRAQNVIRGSWAEVFATEIFPHIDEEPFAVLYSEKTSRPNTPVNVIVGGMILKEMFELSDDQLLENLIADLRYQYALHTTSFEEQPMSDKTLQRFRGRLSRYEEETGIDLMHECITGLADPIAKVMGITGSMRRMDSMMIEANIKKLSRAELAYRCVRNVVRVLEKQNVTIPENLKHYLEPNDYNATFYRAHSEQTEEALKQILADAGQLLAMKNGTLEAAKEYGLLERFMGEQTVTEDDVVRLKTKEDGGMGSGILQNPADEDATFRTKSGKDHRGYVANLEEAVGENGSVVVDYQFEKNNYSDSQFLKDTMERRADEAEPITLVTDGAYGGEENRQLAQEKNVDLISTGLSGRQTNPILADFKFDESGTKVVACPAGYEPKSCSEPSKNGQIRLRFDHDQCANCPHKDECHAKIHPRVSNVTVSKAGHERAKQMKYMETEEFRNYSHVRNGVETVPSMLRNNHHADRMPVRGIHRSRIVFGCKVAALNVRKLMRYMKKKDAGKRPRAKSAQNPVLAGC